MSTVLKSADRVPTRHRRPTRHVGRWISGALAATLLVAYAAIGWYVSGEVIDGMSTVVAEVEYDSDILSVDGDRMVIRTPDEAAVSSDRDAVMGLKWENGWAIVQPAEDWTDTTETRQFALIQGTEVPIGTDIADFDSLVYPGDPVTLGLESEQIVIDGPQGGLPAWFIPGEDSTWLIAVHGLAAGQRDTLRLLATVEGMGYPTLVPTYRNDVGAPEANNRLGMMGQTEWKDLDAAVEYARTRGATGVVLDGISMGGGIVLNYLLNTDDPAFVRGAILESPMADFRGVIDLRSGEALPVGGPIGDSLLAVGRMFVWLRTGLDFDDVDYVARAGDLTTPMLVLHGTDDTKVPFEVGKALADARPDLIDFEPIPDAGHVRAWNEDPGMYQDIVLGFLEQVD